MARQFDPIDPNDPRRMDYPAGEPMNDPLVSEPRSNMGLIGALAVLAVVIVLGLVFWNTTDSSTTATNTSPGVTTGSSTTTPPVATPPVATPPARPDAGKTDTK